MEEIIDALVKKYGYDEPIFTHELKKELPTPPNLHTKRIKTMVDNGLLIKVRHGIYSVPKNASILAQSVLSAEKTIPYQQEDSSTQEIIDALVEKYGYNEPIFTNELKKELSTTQYQYTKRIRTMVNNGLLIKFRQGIYFIPKTTSVFGKPVLSAEKITRKKYLFEDGEVVGYQSGINFANLLGLTTQTASVPTIVTNKTANVRREINFYNKRIILVKPKAKVTSENHKLLQVLDLLNNFDRYSEVPLSEAKGRVLAYLEGIQLKEWELKGYLRAYPYSQKLTEALVESGLYEVIVQK